MKQLEFVKDTMSKLANNSTKLNAAIVLYSTSASVELNFSQKFSLQNFIYAEDGLPFESGSTRIDKALYVTSEQVFTTSRQQNSKIAILITDGRNTIGPNTVLLGIASQPLKQKGVRIFVVGVGANLDKEELLNITERKEDLILPYSAYQLSDYVDDLVTKVLLAIGKIKIFSI